MTIAIDERLEALRHAPPFCTKLQRWLDALPDVAARLVGWGERRVAQGA